MTSPEIYVIVRLETKNNCFTERALYHEEDVPVEKIEHRLEDQDLVCPKYSGKLIEIGKEAVNKLKIIPVQVVMGKYPKRLAKVCVAKSSDLSEKTMASSEQLPERRTAENLK